MADNDKRIAISSALQNARENYTLMSELWEQMARENRTKFDAYVSAGFTVDQAMQLLCAEISKK